MIRTASSIWTTPENMAECLSLQELENRLVASQTRKDVYVYLIKKWKSLKLNAKYEKRSGAKTFTGIKINDAITIYGKRYNESKLVLGESMLDIEFLEKAITIKKAMV